MLLLLQPNQEVLLVFFPEIVVYVSISFIYSFMFSYWCGTCCPLNVTFCITE